MARDVSIVTAICLAAGLLAGCSTAPTTTAEKDELTRKAQAEREEWSKLDPGIGKLGKSSHAFACVPGITKGGLVCGGAYGRGVVFERGQHIGYADVTQASFGLPAGGHTHSPPLGDAEQAVV